MNFTCDSKKKITVLLGALMLFSASGCQKYCDEFNPNLSYFPNPCVVKSRPSAFEPLEKEDRHTDWGKELRIGYAFAGEQDFYRAITAFKRTLVLLPPKQRERRHQVEFAVFECYYFAYKYQEAIEAYEGSHLENVSIEFPALRELFVMLVECYQKVDDEEKANKILTLMEKKFPSEADSLRFSSAFRKADFPAIINTAENTSYKEDADLLLDDYFRVAKSPEKARFYQAILPGAGYYYVGLKNTAVTSFVLNSLFIWATCHFFRDGNVAAGLLTLSLESGWYLGGINGAGIAAREYNERVYEANGREFLRSRSLYPILMLETTF